MITRRAIIVGLFASALPPTTAALARQHFKRDRRRRPLRRDAIRRDTIRRLPPGLRRRPPPRIRKNLEQRARELQSRGEIRPLFGLIRKLETKTGGAVLDAFFVERGKNKAYVLDVLLKNGRKTKMVIDAKDGTIFTLEEAKRHYDVE